MTPQAIRRATIALIALQALVLVTLTLLHGARIASGTELRLRVEPIDPTDLARGSYVALDYKFDDDLTVPKGAEEHDEVYVELERPDGDEPVEATGRVVLDASELDGDAFWITLPVGRDDHVVTDRIGTWYASADRAIDTELKLADGNALAVVSLDEDGNPTLVEVVADER